jgi:hypothetical protein
MEKAARNGKMANHIKRSPTYRELRDPVTSPPLTSWNCKTEQRHQNTTFPCLNAGGPITCTCNDHSHVGPRVWFCCSNHHSAFLVEYGINQSPNWRTKPSPIILFRSKYFIRGDLNPLFELLCLLASFLNLHTSGKFCHYGFRTTAIKVTIHKPFASCVLLHNGYRNLGLSPNIATHSLSESFALSRPQLFPL